MRTNAYGQPIGDPVLGWQPRSLPDVQTLTGCYCRLERLEPARHAWYAIIDTEWPRVREAFRAWLAPDNFDTQGRQRSTLQARRSRP